MAVESGGQDKADITESIQNNEEGPALENDKTEKGQEKLGVDNKKENTNDEEVATSETDEIGEERFRVDRKKLESLLQGDQNGEPLDNNFFHQIEQATNTEISWPVKLKIGAKSKKDPYIKVAGLPEDRQTAKQMVLSVMDTKSTRVTLKMDVSFADHSHVIGKGGNTIRQGKCLPKGALRIMLDIGVMKSTQCHIHFPDSNRTSSEKSNQVSIAGPPFCVESARRQIRELLPIVLKFEIPSSSAVAIPDTSSPVIANIAQTFKVTISFQQQLRYGGGYIGCVKGLHNDPFSVRDAILKILEHLTGTVPVTVLVTTQIEIDPKHHIFIVGRNGCHIKKITQATGARIQFPDPHDPGTRKSTVTIRGTIESAVTAKVYLLQYLPLILMFDIRDGENENMMEPAMLNQLMETFDVQISVKPKPRQFCKSIIVKGHEKNAPNIYKTRLHLIGEDPENMPYLMTPLATLVIPPTDPTLQLLAANNNNVPSAPQVPATTAALLSNESSPLTPPVQSSSPLEQQEKALSPNTVNSSYLSPGGQRIIGSEMKMKRLSVDALMGNSNQESSGESDDQDPKQKNTQDGLSTSRSAESLLEVLVNKKQGTLNKDIESLALSGSWNHGSVEKSKKTSPLASTDSGLSHSQEDLNMSSSLSMTAKLINNLALQRNAKYTADDYELRKKMAKNAMQSQVSVGKVRTPTDAWSGLGFSNSMPEAKIKELWNSREKRANQNAHTNSSQNSVQPSPTTSLDSSVSSTSSSASAHSHGIGRQSPTGNKALRRPPPGLEDSHPSMSNTLFNNNMDYGSILSPADPMANFYANVKCMADLFTKLNLEQYIEAFEKEEVDLTTFISLTDDDLKELGVNTFGARKKMAMAMKDLQAYSNQSISPYASNHLTTGFFAATRHPYALDVAAHSLRW